MLYYLCDIVQKQYNLIYVKKKCSNDEIDNYKPFSFKIENTIGRIIPNTTKAPWHGNWNLFRFNDNTIATQYQFRRTEVTDIQTFVL